MIESIARIPLSIIACLLALNSNALLSVQFYHLDATCGNPTGSATALAQGGTPPYTYLWSNSEVTQAVTGLAPGTYSVTVTDALSDEVTGQVTIQNLSSPTLVYQGPGAGLHGCQGQCNNGIWYYEYVMPQNLVAPFTFSNPPIYGLPLNPEDSAWVGFCDGPGQFITTVTDALGCAATLVTDWYPMAGSDPGPMSVVSTTASCEGLAGGSMTVNVGFEVNNAYTMLWNATLLDENMQPVPGHPLFAEPVLDQNVELERFLPPGNYFVERRFQNLTGDCLDLLPVTIPNLGANCGAVNGTAYMDYNESCQNNGEIAVPGGIIEVMPGPVYTDLVGGNYIVCLPPGSYSLQQFSPSVAEHCTAAPIPFTITASTIPVMVDLPDTSLVDLDLSVSISTGPARPGFAFGCGLSVQNNTPTLSGAITLTMVFDATLNFVSSIPAATTVSGNTITWNLPQLAGWQHSGASVQFTVPADPGLIGTQLLNAIAVGSVNADGDPANNSASASTTVTGSYDPNDKVARTSTGASNTLYFINEDEWIDYTIRFQNTGTDTAFNILVTDTLAATLDPSTLQVGAASHPFTWELRDAGTLKFHFQNILLLDSVSSEPLSHGFVGFRIRPRTPLLPGTIIANTANIFFDYNPPVITEPSVLTTEFSTGIDRTETTALVLSPVPVRDQLSIASDGTISMITVLASDGREVIHRSVRATNTTLDVSGLRAGAYFLLATLNNGSIVREHFVKH